MNLILRQKLSVVVILLLISSCSSWFKDYEDFRFKKAFSQKALNITPSNKDARMMMMRNRGDELIKILTFEANGYELIGVSEIKQKNKLIERGSTITMGGFGRGPGPRGPRGRPHGSFPRMGGDNRGGGSTTITQPDRIVDVALENLTTLDHKYALRFGREIGAEIIISFADSRDCREEIVSESGISCKKYDEETNVYRMSFLRKKISEKLTESK